MKNRKKARRLVVGLNGLPAGDDTRAVLGGTVVANGPDFELATNLAAGLGEGAIFGGGVECAEPRLTPNDFADTVEVGVRPLLKRQIVGAGYFDVGTLSLSFACVVTHVYV